MNTKISLLSMKDCESQLDDTVLEYSHGIMSLEYTFPDFNYCGNSITRSRTTCMDTIVNYRFPWWNT